MSSALKPLEALLLFQYLHSNGISTGGFSTVSEQLKNNEQIRGSPSFDAARLSPDALRDFYLRLLKEEARIEVNGAQSTDTTNGDEPQPNPRKRKAASPSLPTTQEVSQNAHLLPQLIQKLYTRYCEHATIQIKEDERRYMRLLKDRDEIKIGSWDQRLQHEIERGQWDQVLKRKSPARDKGLETTTANGANGSVQPPDGRLRDESRRPTIDHQQHPSTSQTSTPAISPRPSLPPPEPQLPNISPRQTPQPNILPAPGPSQQPAHVQPAPHHQRPPISPRPSDSRPLSRTSQTPMLPPPPPSQTISSLPPYPYGNNTQLPPHSPYAPPQALPLASPGTANQYQQYAQHQPPYPHYASNQGGVALQPFQVAPQTPLGPRQQRDVASVPTVRQGHRPSVPGIPAISTQLRPMSPFDIASLLTTPITAKRRPSTGTAPWQSKDTQWKPLPAQVIRNPRKPSPDRPRTRSISPISDRAISPPIEEAAPKPRRGKPMSAVPESIAPSRSARMRRARGGSVTSSIPGSSARGRTRSQSVISQDVSMADAESTTGRRVKHEPSTPMESSDLVRPTTEGTPNQSGRRGFNKRKRVNRDDSEMSDAIPPQPRQDKSVVIANRNFTRLSQTITNDIQSHKHASLFSNPVRDRDAEGYSDIIRRPQDLKSIRTAIAAGNRAVNAAVASDSFASSTTSQPRDGAIVVLPVSEDLAPPKAIVNPGQLEKEVMRMFANAVMFNPGDGDVVHDAREMAKDVEAQIAKFREVERSAGQTMSTLSEGGTRGVSEVDGGEDESQGGGSKRRKIG